MQLVEHLGNLANFREILVNDRLSLSFGFDTDPRLLELTHLVCPYHMEICDACFLAIVERPIISMDYRDEQASVVLGPPKILHGDIVLGQAEDHISYLAAEMRRLPQAPDRSVLW